jgi:2-hydroxy-3-oxopropionate reductase
MERSRAGVIGRDVIGYPIAERLIAAGFGVAVCDVRPEPVAALREAGARACATPAELARASTFILSVVANAAQTEDVVSGADGMLEALAPGSIFITGSTLGPGPVREIAEALRSRGCETIDAPISGGHLAAREGRLSLMVGGAESAIERALPVLRAFAGAITRAGEVGAGQTAKLAHQLVLSVNILALLEGLALGAAGGIDPAALRQILREGLARSGALEAWDAFGPRWKGMLEPMPPGSPPPNLRKDLHLALELAHELGVSLYVGTQASLIADSGHATGRDDPRL